MEKKSFYIAYYINSIFKYYQQIKRMNTIDSTLRLISITKDTTTDELQFRIQITGKNIFPLMSQSDLKKIKISTSFSKIDQAIIKNFLSDVELTKSRIIAKIYDRKKREFLYKIEFNDPLLNIKKCIIIDKSCLLSVNAFNLTEEDLLLIHS